MELGAGPLTKLVALKSAAGFALGAEAKTDFDRFLRRHKEVEAMVSDQPRSRFVANCNAHLSLVPVRIAVPGLDENECGLGVQSRKQHVGVSGPDGGSPQPTLVASQRANIHGGSLRRWAVVRSARALAARQRCAELLRSDLHLPYPHAGLTQHEIAPRSRSSATAARLSMINPACSIARRPATRRSRRNEGLVALVRARRVPKSVSALTSTRLSARAASITTASVALVSPISRTWTTSCPAATRWPLNFGDRFSSSRNLMPSEAAAVHVHA